MKCPCNLVPPRGVHAELCEFYTTPATKDWAKIGEEGDFEKWSTDGTNYMLVPKGIGTTQRAAERMGTIEKLTAIAMARGEVEYRVLESVLNEYVKARTLPT